MWWLVLLLVFAVIFYFVFLKKSPRIYQAKGDVFVTGCDSGMGEEIARHLAKIGYNVFAGIYLPTSVDKFKEFPNVKAIALDQTKDASVAAAAQFVSQNLSSEGLVGLFNCAGIPTLGPAEHLPISIYEQTMNTNFLGYVRVSQALLPLLRAQAEKSGRRGRLAFVTSGPLPGPAPPLLSSYMASKWAGEAYCQALRAEFGALGTPIDAVMISPTFVRPTNLHSEGERFISRLWAHPEMPPAARPRYEEMTTAYVDFLKQNPVSAPVQVLGHVAEEILAVALPQLRWFTLWDGRVGLVLGVLPTFIKEAIIRKAMLSGFKPSKK